MIQRIYRELGSFIVRRRRLVAFVAVVLLALSAFGATQITIATGSETFLSPDSQTLKDYERFNTDFSSDVIVVMVTGESLTRLLDHANLKAMEYVESQMATRESVLSVLSPFSVLAQAVSQQTGEPVLPNDPEALEALLIDPQSGQIRSEFKAVLPDAGHALIPVVIQGGMPRDEQKKLVDETEAVVAAAGFADVEAVVTGGPAHDATMEDLITKNMSYTFMVSIVLMLIILALVFKVRGFFSWRWLALGMVGIGIIYTFGAVGLIGVPITMISMAAFPILIGLGIDYPIQLNNRYDEETGKGQTPREAVKESLARVGTATGIALIAVCLGFAALLFSPVPMIGDFGITLIIGAVACYLVAVFLPLLILYRRDQRARRKPKVDEGKGKPGQEGLGLTERGLQRLAHWVIRNPAIIIPIALALTVAGSLSDAHVETETDAHKLLSEDLPIVKNLKTLQALAGGIGAVSVFVEAEDVADPEVLTWMVQLEDFALAEQHEAVGSTNSIAGVVLQTTGGAMPETSEQAREILSQVPQSIRRNLVNDDYTAANIAVGVIGQFDAEILGSLRTELTDYASGRPPGVDAAVTGTAIVNHEMLNVLSSGRLKMTLIGVGFIFIGLLLLFRFRILRALIAVVPIGLIISWSSGLMYVLGIKYNPMTVTLGALILGIGVEYTILLMMRYYEERGKGEEPTGAMVAAMSKIGRAIIASGFTTIGGFVALLAAGDFPVLRDFGIVTVIDIFLALLSTLILMPVLIVRIDSWREKRRSAGVPEPSTPE